ncbi:MAG: hypothetical protein PHN84_07940 [Desulfuromonadaceae bacterium]|nr:hypothetical protein [Desulfuromonadaceae bacterium]MDD2854763.1 hypothetical protein [Desulfuromonadaceae bacterium]
MMDSFSDSALSAYFPGLVDICQNEEGQLVYAIIKDGELIFSQEYKTDTDSFSIPERKHFQFTIPRAAEVMRYFKQDDDSLYDDLLTYLKRFSGLDDMQWAIVAHYIFLTYLHDHPCIDYCGYLLFYAVPERGKSRTGKSVTYVAFRGIHLIELREATIFRYSQNLHGTLFLDLLDVSKKAERGGCDDILLLRAEKGAKCCRVQNPDQGPFNDTVYYDIYGPTIIASNEQLHNILETRCLPIIMPNRPGNYENPRPELGIELKERLTVWRAKYLTATLPDLEPIDGISGRLWDITKPMFFINSLLPVDSSILEDSILSIAGEKDESRKDSLEGRLVAIIKEITEESALGRFAEWSIKTGEIRDRFNQGRPIDKYVSPQWIGKRLKSMSFHNRIVHGYSEIKITAQEYALILKQYGHDKRESQIPVNSHPNSLPDKSQQIQQPLKEVESGRESAQVRGQRFTFTTPEEKEVYLARLNELKETGGLSRDEMEGQAQGYLEQWRCDHDFPF